jgi:hypothetical protein
MSLCRYGSLMKNMLEAITAMRVYNMRHVLVMILRDAAVISDSFVAISSSESYHFGSSSRCSNSVHILSDLNGSSSHTLI